jgi:hypothetical protein
LKLFCDPDTSPELMGIWPSLPVVIRNTMFLPMPEDHVSDAAIVPYNRVCEISLLMTSSEWQRFTVSMREHFPALVHLALGVHVSNLTIPDRFLGGSAPRLKSLRTHSLSFPTLPNFLLSATHLVDLDLQDIPLSGYMSPEAFVAGLAVSVNLKFLCIKFIHRHRSLPYQESRCQPPPTRTVLPALTRIELKGACEWLEDVVARIDVPSLDFAWITFYRPLISDIPQLSRFIRRTAIFQALKEAHIDIVYNNVHVGSLEILQRYYYSPGFGVSYEGMDRQLSSLVQVITPFFPFPYLVEDLYIRGAEVSLQNWRDGTENTQWLDIFYSFIAVKNLYVSKAFARRIAPSFESLRGKG